MLEKKKNFCKTILFVVLLFWCVCFLEKLPKWLVITDSNSSSIIAKAAVPVSDVAHTQKKVVASVVIGRLGYNLYSDGTATVTDETGVASGLEVKATNIIIPSHVSYQGKKYTVTAIGQKCFSNGTYFGAEKQKYGKIVLPDTIQTIGMGAFHQITCEELVIPDSVTTVETYAFCEMTVKKDFYYPAGATEIPTGALQQTTVESGVLVIPESITRLHYRAIATRSSVRFLCDPLEIDPFAIVWIDGEIEIGEKSGFVLENGMLLNRDKTELIKCVKATSTKIVVPDTVRRIHPFAFCNTNVKELPKGTEGIRFDLPEGVEIYLPEGLTKLELGTFYQNEWIERVFLPASLEKIEERVFVTGYPYTALMTVVFQSKQVPEIGKKNEVKEVDVPDTFLKNYQDGLKGRLQYEKIY
ncbi:MAG: leucine-rich repeat protein [Lachnospiraceae bacterium]|nr:leucine-rich repeat protein [Lachnospiraceae bacterium]